MSLFAARGVARRPDPPPLQTDDVRIVLAGTALWALALVVLVALRLAGVEGVRGWWMAMCGCGIALGLLGVAYVRSRRQAAARRGTGARPPRG